MITKYLAHHYLTHRRTWVIRIDRIDVDKETDKCVWIMGRRTAKRSSYGNYFDSFDEAKKFLADYAVENIDFARLTLQSAQDFFSKVEKLKPTEAMGEK